MRNICIQIWLYQLYSITFWKKDITLSAGYLMNVNPLWLGNDMYNMYQLHSVGENSVDDTKIDA